MAVIWLKSLFYNLIFNESVEKGGGGFGKMEVVSVY